MIWEIAGIIGINPLPFTLRELGWMIKARQKDMWEKISHLMASSLNANPFLKEHYKPKDLNPFEAVKMCSADDVFDQMSKDDFIK
jgi:hypothetical protein